MLIYVMRRYIVLRGFTHGLNKPIVSTLWIEEISFLRSRGEGGSLVHFLFFDFSHFLCTR
jgi:hypothetical protein